MPTPYELYLEDLRRRAAEEEEAAVTSPEAPPPGIGQTFRAAMNPIGLGKGVLVDTPINIVKGLGHGLANVVQSVVPGDVPYATDEPIEGLQPVERAKALANAALFGLPAAAKARVDETYAVRGQPKNAEDVVTAWAKALGQTAVQDILPGREIANIFQGRDAEGNPLTSETLGENIGMGVVKIAPFSKLLGKGTVAASEARLPYYTKRIRSAGEIKAGKKARETGKPIVMPEEVVGATVEAEKTIAEAAAGKAPLPNWMLTPEQLEHFEAKGLLDLGQFAKINAEVVRTPEFAKAVEELPPTLPNRYIGEAVRKGALSENTALDLSMTYDIPLADVPKIIGEVFERSASESGKKLNTLRNIINQIEDEISLEANAGDAGALATLDVLKKMRDKIKGETPTSMWGKAVWLANRGIERTRRAMMVGGLVTATRNALGQGFTGATQAFEHALGGTIEAAVGKLRKDGRPFGDYYADLRGDWNALMTRVNPKRRAQIAQVLDNVPFAKDFLGQSYSFEVGGNVLNKWIKFGKRPKGAGQWADMTTDLITTFTRMQEAEFRTYFFESRLQSWMDRMGIKDLKQLNIELQKPTLRPEIRSALADSIDHALKQTYAWTPTGGLGRAILDAYKAIPFSTAIFPPFPRFVMNSIRWQTERAPVFWFNMFNKGFRDKLMKGMDGGFRSAEAARTLSKATSGLFMTNAAWVVRNSQIAAGPKYYQILGDPDENGNPVVQDARPFQPFVSYLFLAEIAKSISEDRPLNLTPNEFADAMVGIRRLSEVPAFAVTDIIRSISSDDPQTVERALKGPAGQFFASFFVPLRTISDIYGGATDNEEFLTARDTEDQELTGPTLANIPGLAQTLPPRINQWTGEPMVSEHPLVRQMSGVNQQTLTKLQALVASTPGVTPNELLGEHGSQQANSLVAKYIGQLLTAELGEKNLGDTLTEQLQIQFPDALKRKEALMELFREIRETAVTAAEEENPAAFINREVNNNVPASMREDVRRELVKRGIL